MKASELILQLQAAVANRAEGGDFEVEFCLPENSFDVPGVPVDELLLVWDRISAG